MSILLPEHVDQVVANTLENTAKPLSINVGNTLGDLWFLVFGGISNKAEQRRIRYAVELEKFKEDLEQKCKNIPEEDLKEPDTQIAGQALEKSKYCVEHEKLRSMFSSLITSSMTKSKEGIIHPSFSEIISQMSPDDAEAISLFKDNRDAKAILSLRIRRPQSLSANTLISDIWCPYNTARGISKSIMITDSLVRLRLIEVDYSAILVNDSLYDEIYNDEVKEIAKLMAESVWESDDYEIVPRKGTLQLTRFGMNFLNCVL